MVPIAALGAVLLVLAGVVAVALVTIDGKAGAGSRSPATTATSPATSATSPEPSTSPQPSTTPASDPQPSTRPPSLGPGPITNTASGLCIDTDGPQGPGVQVQVRDCGNFSGQEWNYDPTTHHLTNPPSGLCLDTARAPASGVGAVLNRCGNYTGRRWSG
ncbi:RICIN domain-containing protein [Nonomuraea rubra]|uniref:RICIN domain-containing protein n=1 Tax=Nonomuraea rubra TaxID=46180 RepID=UPI003410D3E9